ncbi:MAG: TonB-dependent receptor [Caldimonas sp.]
MSSRFTAVTLCVAALMPLSARAADGDELRSIQQQIDQLKAAYEGRIHALEARVQDLQQRLATSPAPATRAGALQGSAPEALASPVAAAPPAVASAESTAPLAAAPATPATTAQASASAFNPAISLILNGTYANLSRDPANYRLQGFIPSGGEVGPGARSFSLGESELGLAATIDPTFSGHLTASITSDDRIAVEEAVFERQGIFEGASLKAGRFLSSIGYLNSQHAHAWDFVDAPLVYQAFFGGQMQTDGVHLHWLAPTDRYLEIGAELGAGRGFPGSDNNRNGIGSTALYAHVGDDIGTSASWRGGVSYVLNRARDRAYADSSAAGTPITNLFSGNSRTWVVDGIYKWSPGGNATRTNFKLQGEYFRRTDNGTLTYDSLGQGGGSNSGYNATQSGWYLQAVYQFMPMWRAGLRYDRLDSGSPNIGLVSNGTLTAADFPLLQGARPSRATVMVDYSLSEFSRLRLQIAADRSNPAVTDHQLFLQYIMSLGAHGAHSF